jgi:hypothetical protein
MPYPYNLCKLHISPEGPPPSLNQALAPYPGNGSKPPEVTANYFF